MATKQNGVLATFTPTVSKYTNQTAPSPYPNNALATNGWCMYTTPTATLTSAKLIVANNTGGAANIDVGIVEQTDILQLDALSAQPNDPGTSSSYTGYGAFSFPSGTSNDHVSTIVLTFANKGGGAFQVGETLSWTNSNRSPAAQTAVIQYSDTSNNQLWLRDMSHPLGLELPTGDTSFTGGTSGGTCSVGTSYAGTSGTAGHSGKLRFYDSLNGTIFMQNREFRNNLDYQYLYANDNNENREQTNNNLNRSMPRIWRPVGTTQTKYDNAGNATTPATEVVDANGINLLVSSVSQCAAHQYIVKQKSVTDATIFELSGLVLGSYQSIFVSSTAAVSFTLLGFEETAETFS